MEPSEIIAAINAHVGGDKAKAKEFAKDMRANAPAAAQALMNAGASVKERDLDGRLRTLEKERDDALKELEDVTTEFSEHKSKTPDVATMEARERAKWEPKVKERDEKLKQKDETLRNALKRVSLTKLEAEAVKIGVDPDYAKEVLRTRYADRVTVADDGTIGVLQLGETAEYDAPSEDEKIAALAADIRKAVPSKFINTNADTGAGIRGGSGGAIGLKTVEQIRQEKRDTGFSGF